MVELRLRFPSDIALELIDAAHQGSDCATRVEWKTDAQVSDSVASGKKNVCSWGKAHAAPRDDNGLEFADSSRCLAHEAIDERDLESKEVGKNW